MDQAKVGDLIKCKCKGGPHRIIEGSPTCLLDGLPAARVGDKCSCGATITSGLSWYEIDGKPASINGSLTSCGGTVIASSSGKTGSPRSLSGSYKNRLASTPLSYNLKLIINDPHGAPIANHRYMIVRQDGTRETGITNSRGETHMVMDHESPEKVKVYLSLVGVEK
ncbi:PAAR domain-containing protein [Halopseudomonas pelagia]|uniref:PAAR domain-containing protein n=1 Tax=Halopseudomonas pelagia TaxID=553151 RepID=UPI0030DCF460